MYIYIYIYVYIYIHTLLLYGFLDNHTSVEVVIVSLRLSSTFGILACWA